MPRGISTCAKKKPTAFPAVFQTLLKQGFNELQPMHIFFFTIIYASICNAAIPRQYPAVMGLYTCEEKIASILGGIYWFLVKLMTS